MMCYVGKATKIFIFIVTILVVMGLILGFGLLHRGIHKSSHHCSGDTCLPPPVVFPNPNPTPNPIYSQTSPPSPYQSPAQPSPNQTPPPPVSSATPPPPSPDVTQSSPPPPEQVLSPPPPTPPEVIVGPGPVVSPPGQAQLTPGTYDMRS